jgi:hypothetical protein
MKPPHLSRAALEQLTDGIVLKQVDDLCFVHFDDRTVDASQTRELGERLVQFIENGGCRKLVLSFEGKENIYGFLLNPWSTAQAPRSPMPDPSYSPQTAAVGSDFWLG